MLIVSAVDRALDRAHLRRGLPGTTRMRVRPKRKGEKVAGIDPDRLERVIEQRRLEREARERGR